MEPLHKQLYDETIDYAITNGITYEEAIQKMLDRYEPLVRKLNGICVDCSDDSCKVCNE